jgi:predicted nucleotidyltransferase
MRNRHHFPGVFACIKFSCMGRLLPKIPSRKPAAKARRARGPRSSPKAAVARRSAKRSDPLSMALASGALARLLTHFATHPDDMPHVRALQRRTGLAPRSLQTELARLERLGVIQRQAEGRRVRYRLNERSPRWRALRQLVRELAEPSDVLRDALSDVPGIEAAFLFGSMARGTEVREGSDLDVFIFHGEMPEELLARRTLDAGVLLGREVNAVTANYDDLLERVANGSGFLPAVLRGPKRWVVGSEAELGGALKAL